MNDKPEFTPELLRERAANLRGNGHPMGAYECEAHAAALEEIRELKARLEIDPRHSIDGIAARDETIRLLEAELAKLKAHAEAMAEELQWIAERYDDSKSTSECAADAYEMKCTAAGALRPYRADFPKE